jgi:hypothetical protein
MIHTYTGREEIEGEQSIYVFNERDEMDEEEETKYAIARSHELSRDHECTY